MKLALAAALAVAGALSSSCSVFRPLWMGAMNEDRVGETAPPMQSETWIVPDGVDATAARNEATWRMLAFFLPY